MKKIINMNLSGRVIPIEDSAYESLQRYIESLRRYFAAEEGRDEIINDIESRVAELMNDKVRKGAAAITDADMEEIISSMGRVEDFEATTGTESSAGSSTEPNFTFGAGTGRRFKGRLHRDATDKMIGGVCAGIANYANIDPAIVRLLFAIVTFGGFGMGFLIYILLWIVLPARDLDTYVGKRLFRNPDDRVIGGVAGGLSAYFNKPAWAIRLIFAAPLLLNILISVLNGIFSPWNHDYRPVDIAFGSLTGTFILAYIVLWIVLPEARSAFEKMEMRGEKVDVNRIRQNVQDRAQTWGNEVKATAQQWSDKAREFAGTRGRSFAAEATQAARPVANGIGHAIGVLFKAFFLFVAGSIAFGLFVALIVLIFGGGMVLWPMKQSLLNFVLDGFWQKIFFWCTVVFFFAVPLIAFITWLVRRIMKVRSQKHYLGWVFGGLWTLGWVAATLLASSVSKDFRYYRKVEQGVALSQPLNNRMLVRVDEPEVRYSGDLWWADNDNRGWDLTEDSLKLANIKVRVSRSTDSNYAVTVWKYSAGGTRREAESRAGNIRYVVGYADSVLNLGSGYGIDQNNKFRGQKVMVEIRVPVGKHIRFDQSVTDKLEPVNVRVYERRTWNRREWDIDWDDDSYFDWKTGTDYVMTETGELVEANRPATPPSGVYEYQPKNSDSLRQQIEEKERQLQEDRRRLQELERSSLRTKPAVQNVSNTEPVSIITLPLPFII